MKTFFQIYRKQSKSGIKSLDKKCTINATNNIKDLSISQKDHNKLEENFLFKNVKNTYKNTSKYVQLFRKNNKKMGFGRR